MIAPAHRCKLGGIGGDRTDEIFRPGRVGVCSRSGGMSAEISWTHAEAGLGVSACVSMGGDPVTGMRKLDCVRLFDEDADTDAVVLFGAPGSSHEHEVAAALEAGEIVTPVIALVAGEFQERYPRGASFGHVAAMIEGAGDTTSEKRRVLAGVGAEVVRSLEDIPASVRALGAGRSRRPDRPVQAEEAI